MLLLIVPVCVLSSHFTVVPARRHPEHSASVRSVPLPTVLERDTYVPGTSHLVTNYVPVRDRGHTHRKPMESVANEIQCIMGTNQPNRLHNFTSKSSLGIPTSHFLRFCSNLFRTIYRPRLFRGDSKARSCTYGMRVELPRYVCNCSNVWVGIACCCCAPLCPGNLSGSFAQAVPLLCLGRAIPSARRW